jgi:hypothetical protein
MKLPNVDRAVIDDAKVRDYLLSPEHPVGWTKAPFFGVLGFRRDRWLLLPDALLAAAWDGEAVPVESTVFGQKYVIRGSIQAPSDLREL